MNAKIEAFLSKIKDAPSFVAASAHDPKWLVEFEGLERGLAAVERLADNDPSVIDIVDKIHDVVGRSDLPLKERLLEVGKLCVEARTTLTTAH